MDPKPRRAGLSKSHKVQSLLTTFSTKPDMPQPEAISLDAEDLLAVGDTAGAGRRKGKGLGDGLRSEKNLEKRRLRSATPSASNVPGGVGAAGGEKEVVEVKVVKRVSRRASPAVAVGSTEGAGAASKRKKEGVEKQVVDISEEREDTGKAGAGGGQRKSARVAAVGKVNVQAQAEVKPRGAQKSKKGNVDKEGFIEIGSESEAVDWKGSAGTKKIELEKVKLNEKLDLMDLKNWGLDEPSSLSEAEEPVKTAKNRNKLPVKKASEPPVTKDKVASGMGRTTRSAGSTATGKKNGRGEAQASEEKPETVSVISALAKRRERMEALAAEKKKTSGESNTNSKSKGNTKGQSKPEPKILDDLELEREEEEALGTRTPFIRPPRRGFQNTYSRTAKKVELERFKTGRSSQESKVSSKPKSKRAVEEEPEIPEYKFIVPRLFDDVTTPAQPQKSHNKDDPIAKGYFINPMTAYDLITESPDHLENPKYTNGANGPSSMAIDLTTPAPSKKRKTTPGKYLSDSEVSPLSSPSRNSPFPPDDDFETSTLSVYDDPTVCPICHDPFPPSFISLHPPIRPQSYNLRIQIDRCRQHKRHSAEEYCKAHAYPAMSIDWRRLPRRIDAHIPHLIEILERKRTSSYRDAAGQDLAVVGKGKGKRKLMDTDWQSHTPGYYGPKGAHVMLEAIMGKMANRIREVGSTDRLIAGGGVSAFVQSVLVPELGVRLVMEDLDCGEEKAKRVVKETVEMGELVNDEEEDGEGPDYYYDDDDDEGNDGGGGGQWLTV